MTNLNFTALGESVIKPSLLAARKKRWKRERNISIDGGICSETASETREIVVTNLIFGDDKNPPPAKLTNKNSNHEEDDEDCEYLGTVFKAAQDGPIPQLSFKAMVRTNFVVTASNQRNMPPVTVPFMFCKTFDRLFDTLIFECNIRSESAKTVSNISAKYTWNGKSVRIRRGRHEDWNVFYKGLCKAWDHGNERFEEGCEVEMILHLDE